jgi:ribosomal-protein-alanine N-acetyltransferase
METVKPPTTILETERLILRYLGRSDIPFLVDLWMDPEVTRHMGGPRDRQLLLDVFEETAQEPYQEQYDLWPLIEKKTGTCVGHCGLLEKEVEGRQEIELTYVLAVPAWGKGYATEIGKSLLSYASETLELDRLIALIPPDNVASENVAKNIGMRFEKEVFRPGGLVRKVYTIEW